MTLPDAGDRPGGSILDELKRRRVVRALAVYAAAAFVAVQVADLVFPRLGLPDWTVTLVVWLALLGVGPVLALSWMFDVTPDGVQRAHHAQSGGAAPAWIGGRTAVIVAVLLVFGIGLSAGWFLRPVAGRLAGAGDRPVTVAVLPFQNLSGDPATEPFVLGIHDDLLTQLSRLNALRVISRTSVMEYRGSARKIREIATELGAGAVVEGGVQRAGDRVRLNVQLIDARTDEHLWADSYERALSAENIFAIQADIAQSIARALQAELAPAEAERLRDAPTTDLAALEYYHSGRNAFFEGGLRRDEVAARMFARAVELDPEFADAWAGLANAHSWDFRRGVIADTAPALEALRRAQELASDRISTRIAEAFFHYYARADLPRARDAFLAAQREAPGDAGVLHGLASVERRLGNMREAIGHFRESARLDPRNPFQLVDLGWTLAAVGDAAEARTALERALRLGPDHQDVNRTLFGLLLWEIGDTVAARRFAEESAITAPAVRAAWKAELALVRRDYAGAAQIGADLDDADESGGFDEYGTYYTHDRALFLAQVAWLARDTAALRRWTSAALAAADSLAGARSAEQDRWASRTRVHLARALAYAFRGDTARARNEAAEVERYSFDRDHLTGNVLLDHLVVVDIVIGRHQQALERIEHLLSGPSRMKPARLRLHPIYDVLRAQPNFAALLDRQP